MATAALARAEMQALQVNDWADEAQWMQWKWLGHLGRKGHDRLERYILNALNTCSGNTLMTHAKNMLGPQWIEYTRDRVEWSRLFSPRKIYALVRPAEDVRGSHITTRSSRNVDMQEDCDVCLEKKILKRFLEDTWKSLLLGRSCSKMMTIYLGIWRNHQSCLFHVFDGVHSR